MFHFLELMGVSLLVIEALMIFLWIIYSVQKNVSLVDIGWGISLLIAVVIDCFLGEGFIWRRLLILTLVAFWAIRLVYHLIQRFQQAKDDPRYAIVLESPVFIGPTSLRVLSLYLLQGLIVTILSLPFALMCQNPLPFFCPVEMFGLIFWMVGFVGESAADRQLTLFKQDPANAGKVCQIGLWNYSRHPNYFFEWIIWIGYFMMALSAPWGWLAIVSPVLILYLLLKVSGLPITEKLLLESKGEAYADYQKTTSPFFPWLKM